MNNSIGLALSWTGLALISANKYNTKNIRMELSPQLKASAEEKPTVSTAAVEKKQQLVSQSIPTPPVVDESQDASGIKPFEPTEESDAEADKTAHRTELKTIQTPSVESVSGSATRRFEQN